MILLCAQCRVGRRDMRFFFSGRVSSFPGFACMISPPLGRSLSTGCAGYALGSTLVTFLMQLMHKRVGGSSSTGCWGMPRWLSCGCANCFSDFFEIRRTRRWAFSSAGCSGMLHWLPCGCANCFSDFFEIRERRVRLWAFGFSPSWLTSGVACLRRGGLTQPSTCARGFTPGPVFVASLVYFRKPLMICSSASASVRPSVISLMICSPAILPIAAS